jgi:hypothetical protein
MKWSKKPKTLWACAMIFAGLPLLFVTTCMTFPDRDRDFEKRMEQFFQEKIPGSELALFNGKDLSGWSVHGLGRWSVSDGIVKISGGVGYLATRCAEIDDFILSLNIRTGKKANSGVFFRSRPAKGLRPWPIGYEAQIDNHDPKNLTGSLYDRVQANHHHVRDGEWFSMQISAIGPAVCIKVNGETVVEATDQTYAKGFIALQAHDPFRVVEFQSIYLRIPE